MQYFVLKMFHIGGIYGQKLKFWYLICRKIATSCLPSPLF